MTTINIKRIGESVPRSLEAAFHYRGGSRWIAFYLDESVQKSRVILFDGRKSYSGTPVELFLYSNDGDLRLVDHLWNPDFLEPWLLLDRWDRNLYVGDRSAIEEFLSQPQLQKRLLEQDRDRPRWFDPFRAVVGRLWS
jgi:hypothetical protein